MVTIKNIRNIHAISTNQIADILHFNDKWFQTTYRHCSFQSLTVYINYINWIIMVLVTGGKLPIRKPVFISTIK